MTILDEIAAYTSKRMTAEEEQVSTASLRRQALAMALAEHEEMCIRDRGKDDLH